MTTKSSEKGYHPMPKNITQKSKMLSGSITACKESLNQLVYN